jgi:hypothetical protein
VFESLEAAGDVAVHGDVTGPSFVVPIYMEAAVLLVVPIFAHGILLLEGFCFIVASAVITATRAAVGSAAVVEGGFGFDGRSSDTQVCTYLHILKYALDTHLVLKCRLVGGCGARHIGGFDGGLSAGFRAGFDDRFECVLVPGFGAGCNDRFDNGLDKQLVTLGLFDCFGKHNLSLWGGTLHPPQWCIGRPKRAKYACKSGAAPAMRSSRLSKMRAPVVSKKLFGEIKELPGCSRHVAKLDWSDIQVGVRIVPTKLE